MLRNEPVPALQDGVRPSSSVHPSRGYTLAPFPQEPSASKLKKVSDGCPEPGQVIDALGTSNSLCKKPVLANLQLLGSCETLNTNGFHHSKEPPTNPVEISVPNVTLCVFPPLCLS